MDTRALPHAKPRPRAAEKAAAKRRQATAERLVYAAVRQRDLCCRACGSAHGLHAHHIVYRSQGGETSTANLVLLCANDHWNVHAARLRVIGTDANQPLQFIPDRTPQRQLTEASLTRAVLSGTPEDR